MSAFLLLSVAGCSNDEGMNELVQVPMPEAEDELSYDDNPTTLIGRWHMVKMVAPDSTATIAPGKVALTILDNGYAVVKDDNQRPFRQVNYQYYVDKERSRLGFDVGGIVGTYYCTYEFSEDGMLRMDYMKCSYYFRKLKHEGDFSDINYDELKYRYTYTDTLYIASHLYHQSNGSPFYLVCQGHSNPDAWIARYNTEIYLSDISHAFTQFVKSHHFNSCRFSIFCHEQSFHNIVLLIDQHIKLFILLSS